MDETTEFDAPFKYFSHIEITEEHFKRAVYNGSGL